MELCLRTAFGHHPTWWHFDDGPSLFARAVLGRYLAGHPTRLSVLCSFWCPISGAGGIAVGRLYEAIFKLGSYGHIFVYRISSGCAKYIK